MPSRDSRDDTHVILPGEPPLQVALRRSARLRRLSLRVSRLDGRITVSVPGRVGTRQVMDFLHAQEGWLRGTLAALPSPVAVVPGAQVLVRGEWLRITPGTTRAIRVEAPLLQVPADPGGQQTGVRLQAWMTLQARAALAAASDRHAAQLGQGYARIQLRDTRSRWGSCSSDGRLMYSWRLIMAPPSVLDYVAAHEVAHLVEMNHSPAYWRIVARLRPDHAEARAWLRQHGHALHRFDFRPGAGAAVPDGAAPPMTGAPP